MKVVFIVLSMCFVVSGIVLIGPTNQVQNRGMTPEASTPEQSEQHRKEYSKELERRYAYRHPRTLKALAELPIKRGDKEVRMIIEPFDDVVITDEQPSEAGRDEVRNLTCSSDLATYGEVEDMTGHISEDGTFVVTDYEIKPRKLLKNNKRFPVEQDGRIRVTRPGGVVVLDGITIKFEDKSFATLEKGREYLMFLRYIEADSSYVASDPNADLVSDSGALKALISSQIGKRLSAQPTDLIANAVKDASNRPCSSKGIQ